MKRRKDHTEDIHDTLEPHSKLLKPSLDCPQQIQNYSHNELFIEESDGVVLLLDDSISSEWLHMKYKCEGHLLCFFSKKEFIGLLTQSNKIFQNETLSRCLNRMNNFQCVTPNQTNFEFLQTIHDPQIVLDYLTRMEGMKGNRLEKNGHFFSSISSDLKGNVEFVRTLCSRGYTRIMEFVDDVMFQDIDLMYEFMTKNGDNSNCMIYNRITNPRVANFLFKSGFSHFNNNLPPILLNDKQFWIDNSYEKFTLYHDLYLKLNDSIRYDKEILLKYLRQNMFNQLPIELKQDKDIILKYIECGKLNVCNDVLKNLSTELKLDRDIWLKCISVGYDYSKTPEKYKSDREFLLKVVKCDIQSFIKYNTIEEKEFMISAIEENPELLKELDTKYRNDRDFVIKLFQLRVGRLIVQFLSESMRDDKEIILLAIRINVDSYNYASDRLRNDPEVYNSLWKFNNISNLHIVYNSLPKSVQSDTSLLLKYFNSTHSCYGDSCCFPILGKENKEFLMKIAQLHPSIYNYSPKTMKCDREFLLKCCEETNSYVHSAPEIDTDYYKNDKEVLLKVQSFNYSQVSVELQHDFDIALKACKIDPKNIELIPESLKTNLEFVNEFFFNTCAGRFYVSSIPESMFRNKKLVYKLLNHNFCDSSVLRYLNSDSEFMLSLMVILRDQTIRFASLELQSNVDFVEKVTIKYPNSIRRIDIDLYNNKEFISKIISVHPFVIEHLSIELKSEKSFIVALIDKIPQCVQYLTCTESNKGWIAEISLKYLCYLQQWLEFHIEKRDFKGFRILLIEHLRRKHSNRIANYCNSILCETFPQQFTL